MSTVRNLINNNMITFSWVFIETTAIIFNIYLFAFTNNAGNLFLYLILSPVTS